MKYTDNAVNILTALTYKGIGKAWVVKNVTGCESVEEMVELLIRDNRKESVLIDDFLKRKEDIIDSMRRLDGDIDGIMAFGDHDFPPCRGRVKNSEQPVVLFYKGNIDLLHTNNRNIAVIGLLTPDENVKKIEKCVVSRLVERGVTIVSGLALGCDEIAHKQALESKGYTIAILPGPLTNILPASNKNLAAAIVDGKGLLLSEYYEKASSKTELSSRYQERDRLQALFSDCVVLTASYAKSDVGNDSGSRLAMGYAAQYSVPRAVVCDKAEVVNPMYNLNRQLLCEDDRIHVINSEDIEQCVDGLVDQRTTIASMSQLSLFD